MVNDKYDAFPQAIIILLLDLFLVYRWQQPQRCMLHSTGGGGVKGEGKETRGHRLERYKRVRRTRGSRREETPTAAAPLSPSLTSSLSLSLRGLFRQRRAHRCHHRDTDYKLHSICNEVHLFWRPTLVAPGL